MHRASRLARGLVMYLAGISIILAVAHVSRGQSCNSITGCGSGFASQPSFFNPMPLVIDAPRIVNRTPVVVAPSLGASASVSVNGAPALDYAWQTIDHDGLQFRVWGVRNGDKVKWDDKLPENAENYMAAMRAAVRRARAPEPKPEPKSEPKAERPVKQEVGQVPLNFGVAADRIGKKVEYTAHSEEAQRFVEEARTQAAGGGKLHVTVIGTVDDCAPVVNDINTNPAFASVRDRLMVQEYRPNEWAVDPKLGYQTSGKPTILVQQAIGQSDPKGGRVLYRSMDYTVGPDGLAEAIRKADPGYKPEKDPGPATGKGGACPLGFTAEYWPPIIVIAAIVAFLFLKPSQKEPKS